MHPDFARELINQRTRELRAEATRLSFARKLRAAHKARRREQTTFEPPVIPDYVHDLVGESHATSR